MWPNQNGSRLNHLPFTWLMMAIVWLMYGYCMASGVIVGYDNAGALAWWN